MFSSFHTLDFNNNSDELECESYEENSDNEDKIDSDIEAALYSQIHHCENPVYEPALDQEIGNSEAGNYSKNCEEKPRLYNFNKERALSSAIVISDDSNECNLANINGNNIEFVCENKKVTNNSNSCGNFDNQKNEIQEEVISLISDDDNTEITVLGEINHEKGGTLVKLHHSSDRGSRKSKKKNQSRNKVKKQIALRAKQNPTKRASKRKHSDSSKSEDDVFKYPRHSGEGKDILINVKSSVPVELTKDDDLWYLCCKDIYPDKQKSRYYNREMKFTCNNCSERGHVSRNCKMPKKLPVCYFCGKIGHEALYCLKPACSKCLSLGHTEQQCNWKRTRKEKCTICKTNHFTEECPDRWRRYHMTTTNGPIIYGNSFRNNRVYCYHCAERGHFGHECQKQRMNKSTYPTSPFILRYSDPVVPFSGHNIFNKNAGERNFLKKLAKKKEDAVKKANKRFEKKSKFLADKAELLKEKLNPAPVKQKKKKKSKKLLKKNTGTLPSDELQNIINTVQRKKKRKLNSLIKQTEKCKQSHIKKSKKKKKKLQQSNAKTETKTKNKRTHDNGARGSKFNAKASTSGIWKHIVPELGFSMACMRLLSGNT